MPLPEKPPALAGGVITVTLLEYWPKQPHHLLKADGRTLKAGDSFEAAKKDVPGLLATAEVRIVKQPEPDPQRDAHSPDRTQRTTTTDRRP